MEPIKIIPNPYFSKRNNHFPSLGNCETNSQQAKYHGCGRGTAFVKAGQIIDFVYDEDEGLHELPEGTTATPCEFSCTQILFTKNLCK